MSRVSFNDQLWRREQLQFIWSDHQVLYGLLTPKEQWTLHDYYRPTEDLTEDELRQHFEAVRRQQPSLPNRAGKILTRWQKQIVSEQQRLRHGTTGRQQGNIRVMPVVKPKPDLERLARAIVEIAKQQRKEAA